MDISEIDSGALWASGTTSPRAKNNDFFVVLPIYHTAKTVKLYVYYSMVSVEGSGDNYRSIIMNGMTNGIGRWKL
ncbi:hypothetical protein TMatcc_003106 [Talaromyces marneffei ATCC 18224]